MNAPVRTSRSLVLCVLCTAMPLAAGLATTPTRAQDASDAIDSASERHPGESARLTLSAESITTADRVELGVVFAVEPGWTIADWIPGARTALEDAGWTVVATERDAPRTGGARAPIRHAATITLEPFLPGDYAVPPLSATVRDAAGNERTLTTAPAQIAVESLLPEDETVGLPLPATSAIRPEPGADEETTGGDTADSELDAEQKSQSDADSADADTPLGTLRPPPGEPLNIVPMLMLVGAGIALIGAAIALGVALGAGRLAKGPTAEDPFRALAALARRPDPNLAAVDRHVRTIRTRYADRLDPRMVGRLDDLIARLERARYAPAADSRGGSTDDSTGGSTGGSTAGSSGVSRGDAEGLAPEAARLAALVRQSASAGVPGKGVPA